ncbi:uncharacterized protein LOC141655630 [Silene latifolia]|uniref:uncharacterized protein LOC141655630 n=1 Tax=Silene latifolia TaxID=37657 RepID=UPI003D78031A
MCKTKKDTQQGEMNNQWIHDPKGYNIKSGYYQLQGGHPFVVWHKDVWNAWCVPKHSIISWLIHHESLNTQEKLFRLQICESNACVLCENGLETHQHLFSGCISGCRYGARVKLQLEAWLQIRLTPDYVGHSELQIRVCRMVLAAFWYALWIEKNACKIDRQLARLEKLVQKIKRIIHARVKLNIAGAVKGN